jgi:hypothetical protein
MENINIYLLKVNCHFNFSLFWIKFIISYFSFKSKPIPYNKNKKKNKKIGTIKNKIDKFMNKSKIK